MAHNYCPYELVFCKQSKLLKFFKSEHSIDPLYNVDDYAKESKYILEIAHKSGRILLEQKKARNKKHYDRKVVIFDTKIGDKVLLKNEAGHKLDFNKEERYSRVPRLSDTRYAAKVTKGKWRYAGSKARLKCATYRR